ncbi:hypothetical protein [Candidatus Borrarchaeum sp.]|nr:hypothetical protein [Candidatus Borrarchaeum sp.]
MVIVVTSVLSTKEVSVEKGREEEKTVSQLALDGLKLIKECKEIIKS